MHSPRGFPSSRFLSRRQRADVLSAAAASLSAQYPWIRAVGYLDAEGTQPTWTLTGAGLSAFEAVGQDPYLGAMPSL